MSAFTRTNTKASRLSATEVMEIRRLYQTGTFSQGELSRQFQISVVQIGRIVRGESWQGLTVPERLLSEGELKESADRMMALQESLGQQRLQDAAKHLLGPAQDMLEELSGERKMPINPLDEGEEK